MKLREFKHSYTTGDRVLTLLLLESAEPRSWDRSWQDGESFDSFDQFVSNGQMPVRRFRVVYPQQFNYSFKVVSSSDSPRFLLPHEGTPRLMVFK